MILTEQPCTRPGLDPIAPDNGVVPCLGPVSKDTYDISRSIVYSLHIHELLAKLGDAIWNGFDELIEEMRTVYTTTVAIGVELNIIEGVANIFPLLDTAVGVAFARIANADSEPAIRFTRALIYSFTSVEGIEDGRGDALHCKSGIGSEGDASAYLTDCRR